MRRLRQHQQGGAQQQQRGQPAQPSLRELTRPPHRPRRRGARNPDSRPRQAAAAATGRRRSTPSARICIRRRGLGEHERPHMALQCSCSPASPFPAMNRPPSARAARPGRAPSDHAGNSLRAFIPRTRRRGNAARPHPRQTDVSRPRARGRPVVARRAGQDLGRAARAGLFKPGKVARALPGAPSPRRGRNSAHRRACGARGCAAGRTAGQAGAIRRGGKPSVAKKPLGAQRAVRRRGASAGAARASMAAPRHRPRAAKAGRDGRKQAAMAQPSVGRRRPGCQGARAAADGRTAVRGQGGRQPACRPAWPPPRPAGWASATCRLDQHSAREPARRDGRAGLIGGGRDQPRVRLARASGIGWPPRLGRCCRAGAGPGRHWPSRR